MKILRGLKESERIKLPVMVKARLQSYLSVLDENYGANRDIIRNLGGYAIIAEEVVEIKEISHEIIKGTVPEDVEEIICGDGQVYCSSLFILSSDYAVIVIAKKELTDILLEGLEE